MYEIKKYEIDFIPFFILMAPNLYLDARNIVKNKYLKGCCISDSSYLS